MQASRRRVADIAAEATGTVGMTMFLLSLLLPISFQIGGLHMSPYRLMLLAMFLPLTGRWLSGRCGPKNVVDWAMFFSVLWIMFSLIVVHGLGRIQFAGITFIEIFGGYLAGRCFTHKAADLDRMAKLLFLMILFLLPLAIVEATMGVRPITGLLGKAFNTHFWVASEYEQRLGMNRAQTVFEHPILHGVFCAATFSLLHLVLRRPDGSPQRLRRSGYALATGFFGLSMGGLLPMFIQIGLLVWDRVLRNVASRWKILLGLTLLAYVMIDLASNRTPFGVFVSYLTFNSATSYMRILIFDFGMQNVWANPLFGIGLNDWARPGWMLPTVDNFWLLTAMRSGIPAFLLMATAVIVAIRRLMAPVADAREASRRKALAFTLIGISVSLCTVHIWGSTSAFVMCLIGAAASALTRQQEAETAARTSDAPRPGRRAARGQDGPREEKPGPRRGDGPVRPRGPSAAQPDQGPASPPRDGRRRPIGGTGLYRPGDRKT